MIVCVFVVKVGMATWQQKGGTESTPGPDPTIAKSGLFGRGDIIGLFHDGQEISAQVSKTEYAIKYGSSLAWGIGIKPLIIRIPGVSKASAIEFLNSHIESDGTVSKTKLAYFDLDTAWAVLPQARKDEINNNRDVTLTATQIKPYLKIKTGVDKAGYPIKDPGDPTVAVNF